MKARCLLLSCCLIATGCNRDRSPEPATEVQAPTASSSTVDVEVPAALTIATQARDELGRRLMARVFQAVGEAGHPGAIEVCRQDATPITSAVGEELGVRIGRSSERLRNSGNQPPSWAQAHLATGDDQPWHELTETGELHALFPIHLAQPCLACHGSAAELAPGVSEALAARYPDDRATGYAPGDLRGWFWVEVPAR